MTMLSRAVPNGSLHLAVMARETNLFDTLVKDMGETSTLRKRRSIT